MTNFLFLKGRNFYKKQQRNYARRKRVDQQKNLYKMTNILIHRTHYTYKLAMCVWDLLKKLWTSWKRPNTYQLRPSFLVSALEIIDKDL